MSRNRKYSDVQSAPRSGVTEFIHGESKSARHDRRLSVALSFEPQTRSWCASRGLGLTMHNHNHHWQFRRSGKVIAEWWPSSAKLILGGKWDKGIHTHDATQLWKIVDEWLANHATP